mmetsp:Transcript_22205/g.66453  ORF Transcript_22205/g.66453 Transcript_22205/m.66453 type:complete len:358 (-) Transcript_22205:104-1177(-)
MPHRTMSALMPPCTSMRKRLLWGPAFFGLKATVTRSGSKRCSSAAGSACGSAGVSGNHRGMRTPEPGTRTSFEGPGNSPSVTSKWNAFRSSKGSPSSEHLDVPPFFPTCSNCHFAWTLVTFNNMTTRLRVSVLSTCTRPNSTTAGRASSSGAKGRSSSGRGTTMARRPGRRDTAIRRTRCRSVGASGESCFSRGYSTTTLPLKTCSTWSSVHRPGGTNSGTNSTCNETVSYLSIVYNWRGGCCSTAPPFFRVLFGSSSNLTGWRPTCVISKMRKGPLTPKRQCTQQGLRFVNVTLRVMQDTMPGICAPAWSPPSAAPAACARAAAGCGTAECVNLNIGTRRGADASVPSSSTSDASK